MFRNRLTRAYGDLVRETVAAARPKDGAAPYRMQAKADSDEADIFIYNEISFWGISAQEFVRDLSDLGAVATLNVHISSPGGDVFDGVAIYRALKDHPATVNVTIDSMAASIASVIAMAGDRIVMAKHSMMMIHEPWAFVVGDADDMKAMANALDKMGNQIAGIYADRAGGTSDEWRARMRAETWMSDQEAVDLGLADEIGDDEAAKNSFDLSIFKNAPRAAQAAQATEPVGNEARPALMPDWRRDAQHRVGAALLEV